MGTTLTLTGAAIGAGGLGMTGTGTLVLGAANTHAGGPASRPEPSCSAMPAAGTTTVTGGALDLGGLATAQTVLGQSCGTVRNGTMTVARYRLTGGTLAAGATVSAGAAAKHELADFAPVSLAANVPMVVVAHPSVPAKDLKEFADYAKGGSAPGLFYGSTGPGSVMNLAGEVLKRDAALQIDHVPFRGAAPMVQELVAGRIQLGGDQLSTALPHIRSGALKPLATLAEQRMEALPDVPTVRELGYPNMEMRGWNGFFAPARTPQDVTARLQREVAAIAQNPDMRRRLAEIGAEPSGSSAAELRQIVGEQMDKVRPLVSELKLIVQ